MGKKKKPDKRRFGDAAYVNRGVDANRYEWWDEEDARIVGEETKKAEEAEKRK
jgi:hypothetical protein